MFRAKQVGGRGEVNGWIYTINDTWYLLPKNGLIAHIVIPSTISMKTYQRDKDGNDIYGSFELDGKMTKANNRVRLLYFTDSGSSMEGNVIFEIGQWMVKFDDGTGTPLHYIISKHIEIIGRQYDEEA